MTPMIKQKGTGVRWLRRRAASTSAATEAKALMEAQARPPEGRAGALPPVRHLHEFSPEAAASPWTTTVAVEPFELRNDIGDQHLLKGTGLRAADQWR